MGTKFSIDRALPFFESSEAKKRCIEIILEKYKLSKNSSNPEVEDAIKKCGVNYIGQLEANVIRAIYYGNNLVDLYRRRKIGW